MATTHELDLAHLTVIAIDEHGERSDLNTDGEPCRDVSELREFVSELCRAGYYDTETRDELLGEIPAEQAGVQEVR